MKDAQYWIEKLNLQTHPEGGHFRETYRSSERIAANALPPRFGGERTLSTSIYFLLEHEEVSHFHKIKADEIWHFYAGTGLTLHAIDGDGNYSERKLGPDYENGDEFQLMVPGGIWFGASVLDTSSYALFGCTVAPGFEFEDFELARRDKLTELYPQHQAIIERLTKPE